MSYNIFHFESTGIIKYFPALILLLLKLFVLFNTEMDVAYFLEISESVSPVLFYVFCMISFDQIQF